MTDVRDAGPFERILTVAITGDTLAKAETRAARKLSREMKIKGFRPGKAPRKVVESVVGAETMRREAVDEALPQVVADALRETELAPVVAPRLKEMRDIDGGVEVEVLITLWPELEGLPDYRGRRIEIERPRVTDEDVEEQIDRMRDQFADLEDVDREAFDGDFVMVDVTRVGDGEPIATGVLYEVGSGRFLDGIDIPLRGSKVGTIGEFETKVPDSEGDSEEITARVLVKQVQAKRLPELTDDWVDDVSEFETVAEMRERLTEDLAEYRGRAARAAFGEKLLETLMGEIDLDLPDALVDAEMDSVLHRFAHRLSGQGISIEQYLGITGMDQEAFVEDLRQQAGVNLRTRVLLDAVAEAEGLEVDDSEVDETVVALAAATQTSPEEYRKALEEGGREQTLAGDILRGKARDRLIESAVPVDEDGEEIELPAPETGDTPEPEGTEAIGDPDGPDHAETEDEE